MTDLPPASAESEQYAMERVGPVWRTMSPEEWVARYIHTCPLLGWADYRYPTPDFDAWMREMERIAADVPGRRALRERYLTPQQIAEAEAYEADPF